MLASLSSFQRLLIVNKVQNVSYSVLTKFYWNKFRALNNNFVPKSSQVPVKKCFSKTIMEQECLLDFNENIEHKEKIAVSNTMLVLNDFVSTEEEDSIIEEVGPYMHKLRYEFDHWDDAITGFRETERLKWNSKNSKIFDRVRTVAFTPNVTQLDHVHVLDLSPQGYIKPHIDSTRYCGDIIAGLSLLTDCVMRLVHHENKSKVIDILLKRRSLYIMRSISRYDYTHEILPGNLSRYKNEYIHRDRRISVIFRNNPVQSDSN